jgi:hypothetical protein
MRNSCAVMLFLSAAIFAAPAPTFYKDVLPVLQRSRQECHRPGEAAPMSFLTYESTRPWTAAIREKTRGEASAIYARNTTRAKHLLVADCRESSSGLVLRVDSSISLRERPATRLQSDRLPARVEVCQWIWPKESTRDKKK